MKIRKFLMIVEIEFQKQADLLRQNYLNQVIVSAEDK